MLLRRRSTLRACQCRHPKRRQLGILFRCNVGYSAIGQSHRHKLRLLLVGLLSNVLSSRRHRRSGLFSKAIDLRKRQTMSLVLLPHFLKNAPARIFRRCALECQPADRSPGVLPRFLHKRSVVNAKFGRLTHIGALS
jgi:hypothetical protein